MRNTAGSRLSSLSSPKNEGFPEIAAANVIYRYLNFSDLHNGFARISVKIEATNTCWSSPASIAAFNWQYSMLFSPPF